MINANWRFPTDFKWGVSTSSYQIEGAAREDGRGESIWDRFAHTPGKIADGTTGDVACDHYHRYRDDVRLMQELGLNAYNFSVAWPRVIPAGTGQVNQAGLDFYSRLVDALLEAGITPFVKLYHWDLPQPLEDVGGWAVRQVAQAFADYAEAVARCLGDRVKHWITHLEPWCVAFLGYHLGMFAPGVQDLKTALQASHHLLLSHGLAVPIIRQWTPAGTRVGIAPNLYPAYPASQSAADREAAHRFDGFFNRWFLDPVVGRGYPQDTWDYYGDFAPTIEAGDLETIAAPTDFLGVNYYNRAHIAHDPDAPPPQTRNVPDPDAPHILDEEIYPRGLYDMLVRLHREYGFEVLYITENGTAQPDQLGEDGQVHDPGRIDFIAAHLVEAARAMQDGVPLEGYFVWSILDNFEWTQGLAKRFGLVYVDYPTQARIPKDSARWYRDFIARGALLSDLTPRGTEGS